MRFFANSYFFINLFMFHVTTSYLTKHLAPRAYIQRKSLVFFQVLEPRGKLGIFRSPRAHMEETVKTVTPRKQTVFEGGGETGIFPSPTDIFTEVTSSGGGMGASEIFEFGMGSRVRKRHETYQKYRKIQHK